MRPGPSARQTIVNTGSVGFFSAVTLLAVFTFRHRDGVDAGEPAIEVDVGAAGRAEGPGYRSCELAADRAGFQTRSCGIAHEAHLITLAKPL